MDNHESISELRRRVYQRGRIRIRQAVEDAPDELIVEAVGAEDPIRALLTAVPPRPE
jgi:hypothetical protein